MSGRLHPVSLLQVEERKASLAGGSQAAPAGMAEVSEEDDLQAAEEVSASFTEGKNKPVRITDE